MKTTDPPTRSQREDLWFVRVGEDSVYGPVTRSDLVAWAEAGRIAPGNQISKNREQWTVAENLPDLQMICYVRDTEGHVSGPFNRKALETLQKSGTLPQDISIFTDEHAPAPQPPIRTPEMHSAHLDADPAAEHDSVVSSMTPAGDGSAETPHSKTTFDLEVTPTPSPVVPSAPRAPRTPPTRRRRQTAPVDIQPTPTDLPDPNPAEAARRPATEPAAAPSDAETTVLSPASAAPSETGPETAPSPSPANPMIHAPLSTPPSAAETNRPFRAEDSIQVELKEALACERREHAETLRVSNERELALRQELEDVRSQFDALRQSLQAAEPSSPAPSPQPGRGPEAAGSQGMPPDPIVDRVRDWLTEDKTLAREYRDRTQLRQEALQEAIKTWWRHCRESSAHPRRVTDDPSTAPPESRRETENLQRIQAQSRETEQQLQQRIHTLACQLETAQTAAQAAVHAIRDNPERAETLAEELRRSEQELVRWMRRHEQERERAAQTEDTLLRRIEELERAAAPAPVNDHATEQPDEPEPDPAPPQSPPPATPPPLRAQAGGFKPTPWMRLK